MAAGNAGLARLQDKIAALLPKAVAVAVTDPGQAVAEGEIFASEAAAMARAVPSRRAEFFAGRAAVHRAMRMLGASCPSRCRWALIAAPVWPDGLSGSISHGAGACVAVVAESAVVPALAVDIEPDAALPGDVLDLVCLPAERRWLSGAAGGGAGTRGAADLLGQGGGL